MHAMFACSFSLFFVIYFHYCVYCYCILILHGFSNKEITSCMMFVSVIYTQQKKKRTTEIFPLTSPFNTKMLIVTKYSFLIKSY